MIYTEKRPARKEKNKILRLRAILRSRNGDLVIVIVEKKYYLLMEDDVCEELGDPLET